MLTNKNIENILGKKLLAKKGVFLNRNIIGVQINKDVICLIKKINNKINMSFKNTRC